MREEGFRFFGHLLENILLRFNSGLNLLLFVFGTHPNGVYRAHGLLFTMQGQCKPNAESLLYAEVQPVLAIAVAKLACFS